MDYKVYYCSNCKAVLMLETARDLYKHRLSPCKCKKPNIKTKKMKIENLSPSKLPKRLDKIGK